MIIFGTKGTEKIESSGQFFCPRCDCSRMYNAVKVVKYFTLYFIPVFPLENLGRYIKCCVCQSSFNDSVLHIRPKKRPPVDLVQKIQADLLSGTSFQDVEEKLINTDISPNDARIFLNKILVENRRTCTDCNLTYVGSVTTCAACNKELILPLA